MSYTIDNISEWVDVLKTKPRYSQFRVYNLVLSEQEKQDRQNAILKELHLDDRIGGKFVYFVGDDLAVVQYVDSTRRMDYFIPYAENHKQPSEWFLTFDRALLAAISLKYTGSVEGGRFSAKMLEVPECVD